MRHATAVIADPRPVHAGGRPARRASLTALLAAVGMAACVGTGMPGAVGEDVRSVAVDRSFPLPQGSPAGAVFWLHPEEPERSLLIVAAGDAGLLVQDAAGGEVRVVSRAPSELVALGYGFDAGAGPAALVVAHDRGASGLRAYGIEPASRVLHELTRAPLALDAEPVGLCLYRSPLSGRYYAFVPTDDGDLQQWEFAAAQGSVGARLVRRVPVGKGVAGCAVDDAAGQIYLADETLGIWRLAAEPEADTTRELLAQVAPIGVLGAEVKGIALHRSATARHLLVADEEAGLIHVLALPAGRLVGRVALAGPDGAQFESLWAADMGAGVRRAGVVLVADEGASPGAIREVRWEVLAGALRLPADAPRDPRVVTAATARMVEPSVETEPVDDHGDAADDPAIWVHPEDPARSLVIGAQKKRGVEVYDLSGRRVQLLPDGRTNNVDLRQGVPLGGRPRDIVAGSNRSTRTLALYEMDPATLRLARADAAPIPSGMRDPYGLCMYHSARSGRLYVFMNDTDDGAFRQWEIVADGAKLAAVVVREFVVGSQAEGCVADDETGALYIAEEDAGLWRYGAEPDDGDRRLRLDTTGPGGRLTADVEGVGIFRSGPGTGWIVVSNQGADNYAVYRREGDNAFVGHFSIVANEELGIDGASETDGLDVTSRPLGPAFPHGMLVVQDGRNLIPAERQNYKFVPWERVAAALGLR